MKKKNPLIPFIAGLPLMWPGFDSRTRRQMWVEFVVGSRPCSERFFSGYSGFPLSSKTNIFKFQFDLDYCQALYHEPLAREIAQALPVLLTLNKLHFFKFQITLHSAHGVHESLVVECSLMRVLLYSYHYSLLHSRVGSGAFDLS